MISTSIFTGANIFIVIAIVFIAGLTAIITTDLYQEVVKKKETTGEEK